MTPLAAVIWILLLAIIIHEVLGLIFKYLRISF
jgi:hypothetical protein